MIFENLKQKQRIKKLCNVVIDNIEIYDINSANPINSNIEYINKHNFLNIVDKYKHCEDTTIKNAFVALAKLVTYNKTNINGSLLENIKQKGGTAYYVNTLGFYIAIIKFLCNVCKYINDNGLNNNKYDRMYELINDAAYKNYNDLYKYMYETFDKFYKNNELKEDIDTKWAEKTNILAEINDKIKELADANILDITTENKYTMKTIHGLSLIFPLLYEDLKNV